MSIPRIIRSPKKSFTSNKVSHHIINKQTGLKWNESSHILTIFFALLRFRHGAARVFPAQSWIGFALARSVPLPHHEASNTCRNNVETQRSIVVAAPRFL